MSGKRPVSIFRSGPQNLSTGRLVTSTFPTGRQNCKIIPVFEQISSQTIIRSANVSAGQAGSQPFSAMTKTRKQARRPAWTQRPMPVFELASCDLPSHSWGEQKVRMQRNFRFLLRVRALTMLHIPSPCILLSLSTASVGLAFLPPYGILMKILVSRI